MRLVSSQKRRQTLLYGILLAYILICFALVLYPPFQIACALALAAFIVGYLLQTLRNKPRSRVLAKLGVLGLAAIVAGSVVLVFVHTRADVIHTVENTAYPGKRVVESGGLDVAHTFSGQLGPLFQLTSRANAYDSAPGRHLNQSEDSNFILLLPFLLLPSIYILYRDYRLKKSPDWPLISVNTAFLVFLGWLFVPHLGVIGKVLLLDNVQPDRLLLGMGLLNLFQFVLIARRLKESSSKLLHNRAVLLAYCGLVLVVEIGLGLYAAHRSPGFIHSYELVALSLPIPVIIYNLLRKRATLAAIGFLAFSVCTTALVNPLYRGTSVVTQTPLSLAIRHITAQDTGIWATDSILMENFAVMNGAHSLSGVYTYPQLSLWHAADTGGQVAIYNRYAHVNFVFDRDTEVEAPTELELNGGDHFNVMLEACGTYAAQQKIRFILTTKPITDSCLKLLQTISYPQGTITYIR